MKTIIIKIIHVVAFISFAQCAWAGVLFQDDFNTFSLGTTWQAAGNAPDQALQVINDGGRSVLDMATSLNSAGIETITPISLAGLTSITADLLFTSFQGSMELDIIGNGSGHERWYLQAYSSSAYRLSWDHDPANYEYIDQYGVNRVIYAPMNRAQYYDVTLTLDSQGSHISIYDTSGNLLAPTCDYAANTLSSLGSNFTMSLLQGTGGAPVETYLDSITVTGAPEPTPYALMIVCIGAFFGCRRLRSGVGGLLI
jgi:hypothetical protein